MNITVIGSGKVGTALSLALKQKGHAIHEIYSRNKKTAAALAKKVKAKSISNLNNISADSDLYIICVNDQHIADIADSFPFKHKPVVHTSGATPMSVLKKFKSHGVFYPLNSVSRTSFSFKGTPICISASNLQLEKTLKTLAKDLGGKTMLLTDQQRMALHLSAVFANNFSNALFQAAFEILKKVDIPFHVLFPLIDQTIASIKSHQPSTVQTGPALRDDKATMAKHLKQLKNNRDLKIVYKLLSELIKKQQGSK